MTVMLSVSVNRCLQADSWRVVSASDDRTIKVTDWINALQTLLRVANVPASLYQ